MGYRTYIVATDVWEGIKDGLILFPLYLPLAVTFAIVAKSMNLNCGEIVLWSAAAFAGTAQLACLGAIGIGANLFQLVIITSMITLRQLFVGIGIVEYISDIPKKWLPVFCFCVPTSSIGLLPARAAKGGSVKVYGFSVQLCQYTQWVIFTWLGTFISPINIPERWYNAILFSMPASFIGLMVPLILLSPKQGFVVSVAAGILSLGLSIFIKANFALIISAIIGACIGLLVEEDN